QIEEAFSKGHTVLACVQGSTVQLSFSVEDIQLYRPTMPQEVTVQNTVMQAAEQVKVIGNLTKVYKAMTLDHFICLADKPGTCCNLLDMPNFQSDIPVFLKYVACSLTSKSVTMKEYHIPKFSGNKHKTFFSAQVI
ncbi:hypothetical protein V8E55_008488, partial [Tylopilus felleus]